MHGVSCSQVVPWVTAAAALAYGIYVTIELKRERAASGQVNRSVKKDTAKVVDTVDLEEVGDKKVFCRCWKSKKFPYCDGAHNKHNDDCKDNVGPLIIQKKVN